MKRILDFILAIFLLILTMPIFLIVMVVIKLDTKGPVLFKQKRVGLNGTHFIIYKFRTMRTDTPNIATDLIDHKNYITKVGSILRKTSLDELPQLLNILKGDMSFVGPRPALYNQYTLIEKRNKFGVLNVRPGVTGLAQVNGRDNISDADKVLWDKEYVNKQSLILDFKIFMNTFITIFNTDHIRG